MGTKVLEEDSKTGSSHIVSLNYEIPKYQIGMIVGFNNVDPSQPDKMIESEVTAIQSSIDLDKEGNIVENHAYELSNGMLILEEDVEYYFPLDDEDEV